MATFFLLEFIKLENKKELCFNIFRIEEGGRHVCDLDLRCFSQKKFKNIKNVQKVSSACSKIGF